VDVGVAPRGTPDELVVVFDGDERVQVHTVSTVPGLGGWFDAKSGVRLADPTNHEPFGLARSKDPLLDRLGVRGHTGSLEMTKDGSDVLVVETPTRAPTAIPFTRGARTLGWAVSHGGILVVDEGTKVNLFALDDAYPELVGSIVDAGPRGLVAFLEGGAVDVAGEASRGSFFCKAGDLLAPWDDATRGCRARFEVRGAFGRALAGKRDWLR
jgi:hypothetical protein